MSDILDQKMRECYQDRNTKSDLKKAHFCELIFDGIMCWPPTKPGTVAVQACPDYFIRFNSKQNATKQCEENGKWYIDKQYNTKWTNYSQCYQWQLIDSETALIDIDTKVENSTLYQTWFPIINLASNLGYSISLFALILAIIIFASIKKLQVARNKLHMHLFASFVFRASMFVVKEVLFVQGIGLQNDVIYINETIGYYIKENYDWKCKAITSVRNYFIIANYMLILMEGIYLHNLMFLKLFSDNSRITIYYILGWGVPLLFVIPWVILRTHYENTMCWTTSDNTYYSLIIQMPIIISIIISFILFVTIVRVLFIKLNSIYIQQQKRKYRRLARSTLILMPLFGVPYILSLIMSYTTTTNKTVEIVWIFCDQTFTAFQGFFISLVYCLLNREVRIELRHKYNSIRERRHHIKSARERTISHTQQFSIPVQDDVINVSIKMKPILERTRQPANF